MQGMHIHISVIGAISAFIGVIVIGFFWRVVAMLNHETVWGQAMAFVY